MKLRSPVLSALTLLFSINALADDLRSFERMDVFELEWVSDPQISPDGERVVYVRNGMDVMSDGKWSRLWLVNTDGSNNTPLTGRDTNETNPVWSPDGRRIAFTSESDAGTEVFAVWVETGKSARLTQLNRAPKSLSIRINRRRTVVEFGSGVSSLVVASALDPVTQRLISFEHDQGWANYVSEQLDRLGLADRCQVVHAPLRPCELSVDTSLWYDIDVVRNSLESLEVDVVICDGPPAYSQDTRMARYPAMPALQSMLADSYSVYLDDIDRSSERKIARLWSGLLQIPFNYQLLRGSFAVGVKGTHYNSLI